MWELMFQLSKLRVRRQWKFLCVCAFGIIQRMTVKSWKKKKKKFLNVGWGNQQKGFRKENHRKLYSGLLYLRKPSQLLKFLNHESRDFSSYSFNIFILFKDPWWTVFFGPVGKNLSPTVVNYPSSCSMNQPAQFFFPTFSWNLVVDWNSERNPLVHTRFFFPPQLFNLRFSHSGHLIWSSSPHFSRVFLPFHLIEDEQRFSFLEIFPVNCYFFSN